MLLTVLCALCLLPSALASPLPREAGGMSEPQWRQAQDYLRRFYPSNSETREADSFEARLKRMQTFFRLPVTGVLTPRLVEIMQKPRVISYTRDLPRVTVNQLVSKALALWSREIPLSFRRVLAGTADIMIGFARGAHGDYYPFDGPGNTLAHAFAPGPGLGGDAHFDEDERWTDGSRLGVNFLVTATHELGHSLGLGHSSDPNAVMYPTYRVGESKNFRLSPDDIKGIQKLYGEKSNLRKN
ncbi:matrilysin isoform X2 [Mustela putorius furo]|uniref:Matrilysin isoform X2 n=1 Tax=Mustela putorius furo TaxID=9669 RepID=M3Y706_MUSPF|nr:matrilysin isoform X2 [Mustela putorius furo]